MVWLSNLSQILINIYQLPLFGLGILFVKILAVLLFLLFLAGIVYFLRNSNYLKINYFNNWSDFFRSGAVLPPKRIVRRWKDILSNLGSNEEASWKLAVLDADGILDMILQGMGYKGATIDERLAQIQPIHISNIDEIMRAHEVRHRIARDPGYKLTQEKAKEVIEIYKKTFGNLELI